MEISKILIANDREIDHKILSSYFKFDENRYSIIKAMDGKETCELAERELPDLIVMDWDMPVMDGIEAIKRLKDTGPTMDIPIIVLTAVNKSDKHLKTAFKAGAVDFIRHPTNKIEFMARVKSVLLINNYYKQKVEAETKARVLLQENIRHKNQENILLAINSTFKKNLLVSLKKFTNDLYARKGNIEINHLRMMLNTFDEDEKDWAVFKNQFEVIHNGFYKRLGELHPDLTENEKKFCVYIKIALSSNDIAKLLNISMDGIKKARYRIRKKLKLKLIENLNEYIGKF